MNESKIVTNAPAPIKNDTNLVISGWARARDLLKGILFLILALGIFTLDFIGYALASANGGGSIFSLLPSIFNLGLFNPFDPDSFFAQWTSLILFISPFFLAIACINSFSRFFKFQKMHIFDKSLLCFVVFCITSLILFSLIR